VPTVLPISAKMKGAAITRNLLFSEGISFSRVERAYSHCSAYSEALFSWSHLRAIILFRPWLSCLFSRVLTDSNIFGFAQSALFKDHFLQTFFLRLALYKEDLVPGGTYPTR
jgi:hypothetical protein